MIQNVSKCMYVAEYKYIVNNYIGVCAIWPAANKETSRGGGVAIDTTTAASRVISTLPS
jgi:hypothetical protein